jgi:predicted NUDIX family NTP pyrophosphohydrolase
MPPVSAGLVLFARAGVTLRVLLGHPGGPMWSRRDAGSWTIPKGLVEPGEDLLTAAQREFSEETGLRPTGPFLELGTVKLKSGKLIHAWASEGDCDPATLHSNFVRIQWPPRSGKYVDVPELDRFGWFDTQTARVKLNQAQVPLLDRLLDRLHAHGS